MYSRKRLILFLTPLFLALLSCKAVMCVFEPLPSTTAVHTPSATSIPPLPTATFSVTPELLPTMEWKQNTPTATLTLFPTLVATSTPILTPSALQLQVFEELWRAVHEHYLYPDFNGVDWNAVHTEFRQRVEAGLSDEAFYLAMDEMVSRLGDEHSSFLSPEEVVSAEAEYQGKFDYVGIGVMTSVVPERNLVTIILIFPDSPAAQVGLQLHDNILAVDGQPILDESGFRRDLLRGTEGTSVELTVQSPGQEARTLQITRQRITGSTPVPFQVLTSPNGKLIGYILLATFADQTIDDQVRRALLEMTAKGPLGGLIIDNRQNSGGMSDVLGDTLSFFTHGTLGYFVSRQEERPFKVQGRSVNDSQSVPLVVLIGRNTVSFGEAFAGILKDVNRATLIGEQTEGNVEILTAYNFADGSRAWIARETFRPVNHPKQNWEQSGIIPDISVVSYWDQVTLFTDPVIMAALQFFDSR